MTPLEHAIETARDSLSRGLPLDGWSVLDSLPAAMRGELDVLACRLALCGALWHWEIGTALLQLLRHSPNESHRRDASGFCHAYARHLCESREIQRAKEHITLAAALWPDRSLLMLDDPALAPAWRGGV